MSVRALNVGDASGTVGARVYDTNTQVLLATATTTVSSGTNQIVTLPISATLEAAHSYRVCFYVNGIGSCTLFDPNPPGSGGLPFADSTGTLMVTGIWAGGPDAYPVNINYGIPRIHLTLMPPSLDLTSGTTGTLTPVPQSFNETRGVDVTVLGTDLAVTAMTLRGLYISTASATVGPRIYDSSTHALIAGADVTVSSGSNLTVTVPILAPMATGHTYRVCFFVNAGGIGGSGRMFDPTPPGTGGFPYVEGSGTLQVLSAYSLSADAFPTNVNFFVPLISLQVMAGVLDVPGTPGVGGRWVLEPVRPNPMTNAGVLEFAIPERSRIVLDQFSVTGERVRRTEDVLDPGRHTLPLAGRGTPEGIYFLRLSAFSDDGALRFQATRKVAKIGR
jgi:hypothetical protein